MNIYIPYSNQINTSRKSWFRISWNHVDSYYYFIINHIQFMLWKLVESLQGKEGRRGEFKSSSKFKAFNGAKNIHNSQSWSITLILHQELGQFDCWYNFRLCKIHKFPDFDYSRCPNIHKIGSKGTTDLNPFLKWAWWI